MKNLMAILASSSLLFSCNTNCPKKTIDTIIIFRTPVIKPDVKNKPNKYGLILHKGQTFYFGYANFDVDTFTIVDFVDDGVLANNGGSLHYIPFHDLYYSKNFKILTK